MSDINHSDPESVDELRQQIADGNLHPYDAIWLLLRYDELVAKLERLDQTTP